MTMSEKDFIECKWCGIPMNAIFHVDARDECVGCEDKPSKKEILKLEAA